MRIVIIRKQKIVTNLSNDACPQCLSQTERLGSKVELLSNGHINSATLMGKRNQLNIQHQGELYILRLTRAGKLILTK